MFVWVGLLAEVMRRNECHAICENCLKNWRAGARLLSRVGSLTVPALPEVNQSQPCR